MFQPRLDGRPVIENSSDARSFKRKSHSLDQRDCQPNADGFEQGLIANCKKAEKLYRADQGGRTEHLRDEPARDSGIRQRGGRKTQPAFFDLAGKTRDETDGFFATD